MNNKRTFISLGTVLLLCLLVFGSALSQTPEQTALGTSSTYQVPLKKVTPEDWQDIFAYIKYRRAPDELTVFESFQVDTLAERAVLLINQNAYMKPSNTGVGDNFGMSIAIDGDTIVVGAFLEDSNATGINGDQSNNSASEAGAAYVFVRSGGGWSQQAYLKASNTDTGDKFGRSVAIDGDTIVVGAYCEGSSAIGINGDQSNNSASFSGAAYVFVRSSGVWSQQAYLKASNTGAGDNFGWSVAIDGDTIVVGAYDEDSSATGVNGDQGDNSVPGAGAAYVFIRSATTWTQQAYLKASNTAVDNKFGRSVTIYGDTIVVGSPNQENFSGAAYVFVRSSGVWSQQDYLKASNAGANDNFGWSVDIDADTIVVGAYGEDSNATVVNGDQSNNSASEAGAAYVFVRSSGIWSQQAYLKATNTGAGDHFGSVAIEGDTILVGAYGEDSNATGVKGDQSNNSANNAGAAYVFVRSSGIWEMRTYLKASNTEAGDGFGSFVAIDGNTIAFGAPYEDSIAIGVNGDQRNNSASEAGAAYIFNYYSSTCSVYLPLLIR